MPELELFSASYTGRRSNNEDSCITLSFNGDGYFLAVADGMGGAAGGEVASRIVIETAKKYLSDNFTTRVYPEDLKEMLGRIFDLAQEAIAGEQKDRPGLQGMGSTLTCALIAGDKYVVGNMGDSRLYLLRHGKLKLLTEDHTYIRQLQKELGNKADPVKLQRFSHLLIRAVNGGNDKPDIFPEGEMYYTLKEGELLLLCSDGLLTDKVSTDYKDLEDYILGTRSLKAAAEQLISYAYDSGSADNITVVLAKYGHLERSERNVLKRKYPPGDRDEPSGTGSSSLRIFLNILLILVIVAASGIIIYRNNFTARPEPAPKRAVITLNRKPHAGNMNGLELKASDTIKLRRMKALQ
ncbi:MAG: serine/threonine-protein phosphatase [Ignavibacteria bacterium]|jgi:protein phosphatase|nr:serine/threonine-protein phosphatase [Ignavibacteria bacterium]MCU7504636.1 serine/threonine-protein phosphatase [Ignavibacteria bacterium]MCU7517556.1 serine/threonine-protein phosphatase [Ignavibacteria bacterium]